MAISGDFGALRKLAKAMHRIGTREFKTYTAERMGAAALKQIADEFRGERDPYGNPWAPLKSRKGRILRDTGRMAAGFSMSTTASGFKISNVVSYAKVHQGGGHVGVHQRRGGSIPLSAEGLFMSRSKVSQATSKGAYTRMRNTGASQRVVIFGAYQAGGYDIPRRQMLPVAATGGAGPIWGRAFNREARNIMRDWLWMH